MIAHLHFPSFFSKMKIEYKFSWKGRSIDDNSWKKKYCFFARWGGSIPSRNKRYFNYLIKHVCQVCLYSFIVWMEFFSFSNSMRTPPAIDFLTFWSSTPWFHTRTLILSERRRRRRCTEFLFNFCALSAGRCPGHWAKDETRLLILLATLCVWFFLRVGWDSSIVFLPFEDPRFKSKNRNKMAVEEEE